MLSLIAPELSRHNARGETAELLGMWRRCCRAVALVSFPLVGMVETVAHELVPAAFGDLYVGSVPVFRLYALLLGVRVFLPAVLLEYTGGAKYTPWIGGSILAASALLCVLCIPALGMLGAAVAVVGGNYVTNWLVGGFFARRQLGVGWNDLLDWSSLLRLTVASALAVVPAYLLIADGRVDGLVRPMLVAVGIGDWGAPLRMGRVVIGCLAYSAAFAALAPLFGAVNREDVAAVRRLLPWLRLPGGR